VSYAVRKDGAGWRAVASPDDCMDHETYSDTQPAPYAETDAGKAEQIRAQRDHALDDCEWMVTRHRDQVDAVAAGLLAASTLTTAQYQELLAYRQALRDITAQAGWPGSITWPSKPEWVGASTESAS